MYRCVLSYTSHCFPREHVKIVKGIVFVSLFVSLYIIILCGIFFIAPVLNLTEQGKYFLPGIVVYCESLFSALL